MSRTVYTELQDMPKAIQQYLSSEQFNSADQRLQQTYGLSNEQVMLMGDASIDAVFGEVSVPVLMDQLKTKLVPTPIAEDVWPKFVGDFLREECWMLRDMYGPELAVLIEKYHLDTKAWPEEKIVLRPLTYSGAASEVARISGFALLNPDHRERLRDLISSKIKNVRSDTQVREVLTRMSDFGGLGMDPVMADKAIQSMDEILSKVDVMSEEAYEDFLAQETQSKIALGVSPIQADQEISDIANAMPVPKVPLNTLDMAVENIFASLPTKPTDEYLAKRMRYIISSRLRDIRSAFEMGQILQRDVKVGGVGLTAEETGVIGAKIEEGYVTFHAPIIAEEKKQLAEQSAVQAQKIEERKKKEAEDHAKWFQERIAARKNEEAVTTKAADDLKKFFATPIEVKQEKVETERFGKMVSAVESGATPVSAPKKIEPTPMTIHKDIPPAIPVSAPAPAPTKPVARPEVKISQPTVDLHANSTQSRPRMDDVLRPAARLTGLVQELEQMTVAEFRRLSKDPDDAANKIIQKIETLAGESYERRTQGIKAWQACGLQKSYMALVTESFATGKPVGVLAEEKHQADPKAFSPAEISSILSLNSRLHY